LPRAPEEETIGCGAYEPGEEKQEEKFNYRGRYSIYWL
jgi:hypothetical protein